MIHKDIENEIKGLANKEKALQMQRFFKTGPGEYGEGDIFLGLTNPQQRAIAKKYYKKADYSDINNLIKSKIHEFRLTAILILVEKYSRTKNRNTKEEIKSIYISYPDYINNWDLVDLSAHKILGDFLIEESDRSILYEWAKENHLWKQRIAIISTFAFIRKNNFKDTLDISDILLEHKHDLIHKAVGWMIREVGKRDIEVEKSFLKHRYKKMPRTMLRYAIEKFPEVERQKWLKGEI